MTMDGQPESSSAGVPVELASGQRVLGLWSLEEVRGAISGGIILKLRRDDDGALLSIEVQPRGQQRCLVSTAVGDVSYVTSPGVDDRDAHRATLAVAKLLDEGALPILRFFPHLAMPAIGGEDEQAEQARRSYAALISAQVEDVKLLSASASAADVFLPEARPSLFFDALGIAEFLAPELRVDGPAVAGFVLKAIYPPAVARRQAQDFSRFVLELESAAGSDAEVPVARVQISASSAARGSFGEVGPLSLSLIGYEGSPEELPLSLSTLSSWLLALLRLKQGSTLEVRIPSGPDEVRALSIPLGRAGRGSDTETGLLQERVVDGGAEIENEGPRSLNLAIDAPCRQQCAFCSVQYYVRPADGGEQELARIRQQLQIAREQSVREVRLNGIDPLGFSRVLDVVSTISTLGFPRLSVFSPCRRLADEKFRREFLRRAPADLMVTIPLYGVTAETHDAVTGAPGAHAEVMRAIAGMKADMQSGELRLSTVVVRRNLDELVDIARYAQSLDLQLDLRLPYPMRQTVDDPYADAALREEEIVARLLESHPQSSAESEHLIYRLLRDLIPHPCLLFRAEQSSGRALFPGLELRERPLLPGTEYRSSDFAHTPDAQTHGDAFAPAVVACPHTARCALASVCPGEQFSVYQQIYGLDELQSVTPAELYAHVPSEPPVRK